MKNVRIAGASLGIGRAVAFEFARRGHDLAFGARRVDALEGSGLGMGLAREFATCRPTLALYAGRTDLPSELHYQHQPARAQ